MQPADNPMLNKTIPFLVAKIERDRLESVVRKASLELAAIQGTESGPMGLTPDHIKALPEYQAAKRKVVRAIETLRTFNSCFTKQYKAELAIARETRKPRDPWPDLPVADSLQRFQDSIHPDGMQLCSTEHPTATEQAWAKAQETQSTGPEYVYVVLSDADYHELNGVGADSVWTSEINANSRAAELQCDSSMGVQTKVTKVRIR